MFGRPQRHVTEGLSEASAGPAFTEAARRGVGGDARAEAQRLGHAAVETEHVLLALTRDPTTGASALLTALLAPAGVELATLRAQVEAAAVPRTGPYAGRLEDMPYTGRVKRALDLAVRETRALRHSQLGTEHLLTGLLAERRGVAAQVLIDRGVTLEAVRAALRHAGTRDGAISQGPAGDSPVPDGGAPAAAPGAPGTPHFQVVLDDASDRSIYEQVVAQVQEAVATGRLAGGERLATVRQLADALDVAPGTVARAYAELERLGVVVAEGTRGTRVALRPPLATAGDLPATLVGLLRPVAVAAFHLGASAPELRDALAVAMAGILVPDEPGPAGPRGQPRAA